MPPRSKPAPPPVPETRDALAQAVTELTGQVETLNGLVDKMHQRMAVLTAAIDDIRQEFEYAVRNGTIGRGRDQQRRPTMDITSMPKDPSVPNFAERVNRHSAKDVPTETAPPEHIPDPTSASPEEEREAPRQRDLF
jgi:hypothetical protein